MEQKVLNIYNDYSQIGSFLMVNGITNFLLVCGKSFSELRISNYINELKQNTKVSYNVFSDFNPNPNFESVIKGIEAFKNNRCDAIVAIGGGSAIDVAKCIKLYMNSELDPCSLPKEIAPADVMLIAMPTTAGSGSEATKFSVIYIKGEKQSISSEHCIPDLVVLDSSTLKSLPLYQRKATMLDALCHSMESFWSINSNEESKNYSLKAIKVILDNYVLYLDNDDIGNRNMLDAAYYAGRAINIAQTTAGHAMSYKLTGLYGIAHGHAVALCVSKLFNYMIRHIDDCIDPRGKNYINNMFDSLADAFDCASMTEAVNRFADLLNKLNLPIPQINECELQILVQSVNQDRLKNNPIKIDKNAIIEIYSSMKG